jgi:hypothetical protein
MAKNKQPNDYFIFLLFLLSFFILFLLFRWLDFLVDKKYLQSGTYLELFTSLADTYKINTGEETNTNSDTNTDTETDQNTFVNNDSYNVNYIHSNNIDLPAMSKYTCSNWCGPKSQCLLSREQCFSDVDCKGCKDLTAVNNFYDDSSSDLGGSYMNKSTNDLPKDSDADILCSKQICTNNYASFDKRH